MDEKLIKSAGASIFSEEGNEHQPSWHRFLVIPSFVVLVCLCFRLGQARSCLVRAPATSPDRDLSGAFFSASSLDIKDDDAVLFLAYDTSSRGPEATAPSRWHQDWTLVFRPSIARSVCASCA